jgi:hypothetical protein
MAYVLSEASVDAGHHVSAVPGLDGVPSQGRQPRLAGSERSEEP